MLDVLDYARIFNKTVTFKCNLFCFSAEKCFINLQISWFYSNGFDYIHPINYYMQEIYEKTLPHVIDIRICFLFYLFENKYLVSKARNRPVLYNDVRADTFRVALIFCCQTLSLLACFYFTRPGYTLII